MPHLRLSSFPLCYILARSNEKIVRNVLVPTIIVTMYTYIHTYIDTHTRAHIYVRTYGHRYECFFSLKRILDAH